MLRFTSPSGPGSSVGAIGRVIDPCMASVPQIAEIFCFFFPFQELGLSVPAVKGYRAALNHVFSLTGIDLAASTVVSWVFCSFERSCPPQKIRPLDWNMSLVLQCLFKPPFEPLKLSSDKHFTWKTSFLLVLVSAKRVSELHGLSCHVRHLRSWSSCTFYVLPDFMVKTQNPSVPDSPFVEFSVLSLDNFVGGDQD